MDLVRRVDRLPKPTRASEALQPLFEAISNSIHSTQEKFKTKIAERGRIIVEVETGRKQAPVHIRVVDNGVGLNDKHYSAFVTTDTDNKINIGGKGVGRLLWLDCFQKIRVESVYIRKRELRKRAFEFRLSEKDQIQGLTDHAITKEVAETGMTVTFDGVRDNGYREAFPGRPTYVFQHLTSHFLPTFIGGKSPRITVICGDETREFPSAIDEIIYRRENIESLKADDFGELSLILMECDKIASSDLSGRHFIHFIAHDRTVLSQNIDGKLGLRLFGENGDRAFHACLFGEFLDKNVNQERTRFTFDDATVERIVNEACMPHIGVFLAKPIAALKEEQASVVENIVAKYPSVQFGSIDELQQHVPMGELADDAIYGHLSRQRFRRDQKQAEKIRSAFSQLRDGAINNETFAQTISEASEAIEEAEQRSLTEYIVRRKVVLDFLSILLEKVRHEVRDSSYQKESVLHTFISPMQVTTVGKRVEK